jgi:hypothetical protein
MMRIQRSCGKLQARCGRLKAVFAFRRADDGEKARRFKRLIRMMRRADARAPNSSQLEALMPREPTRRRAHAAV